VLIAVDFDGVIAKYDGWEGYGIFGKPLPRVAEALAFLRDAGNEIIINTCRIELDLIEKYLKDNNIQYDYINHSPQTEERNLSKEKQSADIYIDDRGICFKGEWNEDFVKAILTFKPWWKHP